MSQSILFKNIISKKVEKEYVYIIYKSEIKNKNEVMTPLKICYSYDIAIKYVINYNINEFCGSYIISNNLLKILKSKKNDNAKYNWIMNEYDKLFKNDSDKFSIKIKIVEKKSIVLDYILKRVVKSNYNNMKLKNINDYIYFYNFAKTLIKDIEKKCGLYINYL